MKVKYSDLVPAEVRRRYKLGPKTRDALKTLAAYDLSFLTDNFTQDKLGDFSPEQLFPLIEHFGKVDKRIANRLELEFRRFIVLTLLRPSKRNAPSGPVDMYWHFFVLHTPDYVKFCTTIWGKYGSQPRKGGHYYFQTAEDKKEKNKAAIVDHVPATEETRPDMFEAYRSTYELYKEVFGRPNPKYWPAPGTRKKRDGKFLLPVATCGDSYSGFVADIVKNYSGSEPLYTL